MSRSELHDWEYAIKKLSGDNADKMLAIAQDIYNTAFARGKNQSELEQEPKIGHWDTRACKCSECGYQITFSEYTEHKYKYCPNCGAKMEGEE